MKFRNRTLLSILFGMFLLFTLPACQTDGEFIISLDFAASGSELSPFRTNAIQYLNLTLEGNGKSVSFASRYDSEDSLSLGNIALGNYSRVVLKGNSIDGVMVAYGAVDINQSIKATGEQKIRIPFRYPLIYLG
ncbi:hypothetical protein KKF84_10020, partial [Myxococcota bacterium]|nr:hypothetical protein [Myxococcota bacterium]